MVTVLRLAARFLTAAEWEGPVWPPGGDELAHTWRRHCSSQPRAEQLTGCRTLSAQASHGPWTAEHRLPGDVAWRGTGTFLG